MSKNHLLNVTYSKMTAIMKKVLNMALLSLALNGLSISLVNANDYNPVLKVEGSKCYVSLEGGSAPATVRILDRKA